MELIFQGQNHLKCCQLGGEGPVWPLSNTAFFFFISPFVQRLSCVAMKESKAKVYWETGGRRNTPGLPTSKFSDLKETKES